MIPFLRTFGDVQQEPAAAGVVMTSILRPTLAQALRSVLAQQIDGRVHVVLGLDQPGDLAPIEAVCRERPPGFTVQVLWPGYSTSERHGGVHHPHDGGALRCMLSHWVNSRRVAYLDDDNWWATDHLQSLTDAMANAPWAYSLRWFVAPDTRTPICIDTWESVGPGHGVFGGGVYAQPFGGFVDPNCLMLDKIACPYAVAEWIGFQHRAFNRMATDRFVFDRLRQRPGVCTQRATAFYVINPSDGMHPSRIDRMGKAWTRRPIATSTPRVEAENPLDGSAACQPNAGARDRPGDAYCPGA